MYTLGIILILVLIAMLLYAPKINGAPSKVGIVAMLVIGLFAYATVFATGLTIQDPEGYERVSGYHYLTEDGTIGCVIGVFYVKDDTYYVADNSELNWIPFPFGKVKYVEADLPANVLDEAKHTCLSCGTQWWEDMKLCGNCGATMSPTN